MIGKEQKKGTWDRSIKIAEMNLLKENKLGIHAE